MLRWKARVEREQWMTAGVTLVMGAGARGGWKGGGLRKKIYCRIMGCCASWLRTGLEDGRACFSMRAQVR